MKKDRKTVSLFSTGSKVVSPKCEDLGKIVGHKYQTCIIVDGVPHYSASFFGNDEYVDSRVRGMQESIRLAKVEVINGREKDFPES
jgi:hypothetical protein